MLFQIIAHGNYDSRIALGLKLNMDETGRKRYRLSFIEQKNNITYQ
ncbi:hypothetical protein SAMN04487773_1985 [Enterobacter sp. kpr-6]|nr:hypothetical protein SAMN04487773_1985 [Enterobacter sp. kpr-6]